MTQRDGDDDYVEIPRYVHPLEGADASKLPGYHRAWLRKQIIGARTLESHIEKDKAKVTVLVSPSGTGKTPELKHLARRARAKGLRVAFLDAGVLVKKQGDPEEIDEGERAAFAAMKAGAGGVLILDALDQLSSHQLTSAEFFRRLPKCGLDLRHSGLRLVFSTHNGVWPSIQRELQRFAPSLAPLNVGADASAVVTTQLLQFDPLGLPEIRKLAAARLGEGHEDLRAFLSQFEEEEIASLIDLRPADIPLFVTLWQRRRSLRDWTRLLDDAIDSTLVDDREERGRAQRLSPEAGRHGLERIAAATLLMGRSHISTPGIGPMDGAVSSRRLFADWSPAELAELFENPLFVHKGSAAEVVQLPQGPASYRLAARWFAARQRHGRTAEELREDLLVRVYDEERFEIPMSHREVVGWLASDLPELRRLLLHQHPDLVLFGGDPNQLSDADVREALTHGQWSNWQGSTPAKSRRLARKSLEEFTKTQLESVPCDDTDNDYRTMAMLSMVEHGAYRSCVDRCIALASGAATPWIRRHAVAAVVGAAPDRRGELVRLLRTELDPYVRAELMLALVPEPIHGDELVDLLVRCSEDAQAMSPKLRELAGRLPRAVTEQVLGALSAVMIRPSVDVASTSALTVSIPLVESCLRRGEYGDALTTCLWGIERTASHSRALGRRQRDALDDALRDHPEVRRALWELRLPDWTLGDRPTFGEAQPEDAPWLFEHPEPAARTVLGKVWGRAAEEVQDHMLASASGELHAWLQQRRASAQDSKRAAREREAARHIENQVQRQRDDQVVEQDKAEIESGKALAKLRWAWFRLPDGHDGESPRRPSLAGLAEDFGEASIRTLTQGLKNCWRHVPITPRGVSDVPTDDCELALFGLRIEAPDVTRLSETEAQRLARLGTYALNDFPAWYADLLECHSIPVREALTEQIGMEWASNKETHGVLRLAPFGDRGVSEVVRSIALEFLKKGPPVHPKTVEYAVEALLASSPDAPHVAMLAHQNLKRPSGRDADPQWLRLWAHMDPEAAADWLEAREAAQGQPSSAMLAKVLLLLTRDLSERYRLLRDTPLQGPRALARWARLASRSLSSPHHRGDPHAFRNQCISALALNLSSEARSMLVALRADPLFAEVRGNVDFQLDRQRFAAINAAAKIWEEEDVLRVERGDEKPPRSLRELFHLVQRHLRDVGALIENDDFSYRELFVAKTNPKDAHTKETEIQLWAASCLRQRARGLYHVVRENVVDRKKEVDISAAAPGIGEVPIEIKPLGAYSFAELKDVLKDQLLGQYMRTRSREYGILLLVRRDLKKKWVVDGESVDLDELVDQLRQFARKLGERHGKILDVALIDLRAQTASSPRLIADAAEEVQA
jgi:hypothetical protein